MDDDLLSSDQVNKMFNHKINFTNTCLSFLIGAVILILLSLIQKIIAGYNPFIVRGYLVAILFGGVAGVIIGIYIDKVRGLNAKLKQRVNTLESILSICSNCKKIREPNSDPKNMNSWKQLESFISKNTSSEFSHSVCPDCMIELYGDILKDCN